MGKGPIDEQFVKSAVKNPLHSLWKLEYRNCDEHYSWGLYSTEENARMYLNHMRWNDNDDFVIIEHKVDEKLRFI